MFKKTGDALPITKIYNPAKPNELVDEKVKQSLEQVINEAEKKASEKKSN